jgi:prepilin signal peptidase PulO-like enzyme (type II secretory pathway)
MIVQFLIGLFIFGFGLCIGSFLNCFIYRLEIKKSLKGRSFCPHCKHELSWLDLFPVFSFLFLQGKCRYCNKKISWQYPAVELATAVIFLLIFCAQGAPASGWQFFNLAFLFYIASVLIIIFVYDLKHYIIPDKVLFPAIIISVFYNIFFNYNNILNYFWGVLVGAGFFLAIFLISKGNWMGFGDVKLAVLMGLLLGLPNVLAALFLAFFFGAIIGIILMVFGKKKMKSEIPFGPFLIIGTFLALLWGQEIINWYLFIFI